MKEKPKDHDRLYHILEAIENLNSSHKNSTLNLPDSQEK